MPLDNSQYGHVEDHATDYPLKLLIRFHHGLGDTVQLGVVLKHLRKYRPNWQVDVWCGRGKHSALIGLCHRVWHDKEQPQPVIEQYDRVVEPGFWEDRSHSEVVPNTKAMATLRDMFGIAWDASLGTYEIDVPRGTLEKSDDYLRSIGASRHSCEGRSPYHVIIFQYQGNTSPQRKNLAHWQVECLCDQVLKAGRVPIILDWDGRSPLPDGKTIHCPGVAKREGESDLWGGFGSGDAATIAALIQLSEAFIGVDSGPAKCASATDTPSLVCWSGHHPMNFHDPAPNTWHLVPQDHWRLEPLSDRCQAYPPGENKNDRPDYPSLGRFFRDNYQVLTYEHGPHGQLWQSQRWLAKVLGQPVPTRNIEYVVPGGIGDSVWALHKIQAVNRKVNPCTECDGQGGIFDPPSVEHGARWHHSCDECDGTGSAPIDIILSGDPQKEVDNRAVPFLKRFKFIRSVRVLDIPVLQDQHNPADRQGRYRYQPDGLQGSHYFLTPNHALERGTRLENWLPDVPVDWDVMEQFNYTHDTKQARIEKGFAMCDPGFVAFYLGPLAGNTEEGHNRGPIWTPDDWMRLASKIEETGRTIAIVGAEYDRSYFDKYFKGAKWRDFIGGFEIGETFSFLTYCDCLVSYQCGLAIVHHYLGGNVVSWWRADQDSIHPNRKICFDERMASAWCNPKYLDNYIPLIYGRQTADEIFEMIQKKHWI